MMERRDLVMRVDQVFFLLMLTVKWVSRVEYNSFNSLRGIFVLYMYM